MDEYLQSKGRSVDVLIHDGCYVRKLPGEVMFPDELLRGAEGYTRQKTGYDMVLKVKPIEHNFAPPTSAQTLVVPAGVMIDDSYAAKKFVEMVGDKIRKCGGELYVQNNEGIWEIGDDAIRGLIEQYEERLIWKQYNALGMIKIHNYGGDVKNIAKLITQLKVKATPGKLPLQMAHLLTQSDGGNYDDAVTVFLELIQNICGGKANPSYESLCRYVIQWLAHALQKPYELPGTALIISGAKGTGKDTPLDFLIAHVFGQFSAINYTDNKLFFDKHDTGRKGMFFVKLEEADRRMCLENSSFIKSMITGKNATFNPKNKTAVSIDNFIRFVATLNGGNSFDFTDDERRFVIVACSAEKRGDTVYWQKVRATLFNDQAGKAVAEFLLAIDLTNFNVRQLPENQYQADVVEASLKPEQRFVTSWNGEKTYATAFYQLYRDYCLENNYTYVENQTKFGNIMLPFVRDVIILKKRDGDGLYYMKPGM
jgi:hypothetical protein